ncbi:MAG: hypothetical protein LBF21_02175 [Puniceicoccales bacterium]|nr:hypothetical protein [Puniceicoccales bacterium]
MRKFYNSQVDVSWEIYAEGSPIVLLLFGCSSDAYSLIVELWPNCSPSRFHQETSELDHEGRIRWFLDFLNACNDRLRRATGNAYDAETIQKLSELLAWMMDPEPTHRPTSQQVFTSLLGIWEATLEKLPPKHPAEPLRPSPRWGEWRRQNEEWFHQHADEEVSATNHPPLLATPVQRQNADQQSD